MKPFLLTIIILSFCSPAFPQNDSLQKQINDQVWKPFITAFNANDNDALSAVHSKDVTRVMQDDKQIIGYQEYFRKIPDSVRTKWSKWKQKIELRFTQRIAANGRAFEVGYYKTTSTNSETGENHMRFGKFHVLLRKENNVWKILMDADASEKTDETVFRNASPME